MQFFLFWPSDPNGHCSQLVSNLFSVLVVNKINHRGHCLFMVEYDVVNNFVMNFNSVHAEVSSTSTETPKPYASPNMPTSPPAVETPAVVACTFEQNQKPHMPLQVKNIYSLFCHKLLYVIYVHLLSIIIYKVQCFTMTV